MTGASATLGVGVQARQSAGLGRDTYEESGHKVLSITVHRILCPSVKGAWGSEEVQPASQAPCPVNPRWGPPGLATLE